MRFSGKIVLVAGGTGGLGRAVSLAFLAEGATTIVSYRRQQEFESLKNASGTNLSRLFGQGVDVTEEAAVQQFLAKIIAEHGRLDVMVNTVGGYAGGLALWETEPHIFDQMLALNLRTGYVLSRVAVPIMLKQTGSLKEPGAAVGGKPGSGVIVSIASRSAVDHAAGASAYAASKAAALAMTDCLAADLKDTGVRVNSVLPSIIDTEPNRRAMPHADFSKWPKPEDIARVVLFLCSEDAKLIHGAAIPVYGS